MRVLALLFPLFVAGCAVTVAPTPAARWAGLSMDGLVLDLVDPHVVAYFSFSGSGIVAATVGERDGYLAGPAYSWRVRGEWLEIGAQDQQFTQRLRATHVGQRTITVEDEKGRRSVYKYRTKA